MNSSINITGAQSNCTLSSGNTILVTDPEQDVVVSIRGSGYCPEGGSGGYSVSANIVSYK